MFVLLGRIVHKREMSIVSVCRVSSGSVWSFLLDVTWVFSEPNRFSILPGPVCKWSVRVQFHLLSCYPIILVINTFKTYKMLPFSY